MGAVLFSILGRFVNIDGRNIAHGKLDELRRKLA